MEEEEECENVIEILFSRVNTEVEAHDLTEATFANVVILLAPESFINRGAKLPPRV